MQCSRAGKVTVKIAALIKVSPRNVPAAATPGIYSSNFDFVHVLTYSMLFYLVQAHFNERVMFCMILLNQPFGLLSL